MRIRKSLTNRMIQTFKTPVARRRTPRAKQGGGAVQGLALGESSQAFVRRDGLAGMTRRIGVHKSNIFYQGRGAQCAGLAVRGLAAGGGSSIHGLHNSDMACITRSGFRIIFLQIEADHTKTITLLHSVFEVYFLPPSYLLSDNDPFLIGSVNIFGSLSGSLASLGTSTWNTSITVSCPYHQGNAGLLPAEVRDIGVGAFITGVVQALFGTRYGLEVLGLGDHQMPEVERGSTNVTMLQR